MSRAKFKIRAKINEETLDRLRDKRTATGWIFIEVNGLYFPEHNWDDFVFAVLGAWIHNAMLFERSVVEIENPFMDGPLAFRVRRETGATNVSMSFYRNDEKFIDDIIEIPFRRYLAELRGAAKSVLNEVRARGLADCREAVGFQRDLDALVEFEASR